MDGMIADKCREAEYILGASCNKEMTMEKSVKESKVRANARIKDWARKSQANLTWLRLRLCGA